MFAISRWAFIIRVAKNCQNHKGEDMRPNKGSVAGRIVLCFGAVLVALLMSGCGGINSGEIASKQFVKAHETTELRPVYVGQTCSSSGASLSCIPNYMQTPYQKHHPDAWYLHLKDSHGKKGRVSVSQSVFSEAQVGDFYNADGSLSALSKTTKATTP